MHARPLASIAAAFMFVVACGGPPPPAPVPQKAPDKDIDIAPPASAMPAAPPPLVEHIDEAKADQVLGADFAKLLSIGKASPKTHKALLNGQLWVALHECPNVTLVDVVPADGLFVASKIPLKVREKTYKKLVAAGARARQRGMGIEVVGALVSVKDAVADWNHAVIEAAAKLVKAATPADLKDKSFAADAKNAVGEENSPKHLDSEACESGRLGGAVVTVQLVTVDASRARGKVLVKAGPDGDRFAKDEYNDIYWNKVKGKSFRTLTEIMSVGFIRACSSASLFFTSTIEDGTWRCKESGDSWDPANRPIPSWQ